LDIDHRGRCLLVQIGEQLLGWVNFCKLGDRYVVDERLLECCCPTLARLNPLVCTRPESQSKHQNGCTKCNVFAVSHENTPQ
jgi:hypothetical protein